MAFKDFVFKIVHPARLSRRPIIVAKQVQHAMNDVKLQFLKRREYAPFGFSSCSFQRNDYLALDGAGEGRDGAPGILGEVERQDVRRAGVTEVVPIQPRDGRVVHQGDIYCGVTNSVSRQCDANYRPQRRGRHVGTADRCGDGNSISRRCPRRGWFSTLRVQMVFLAGSAGSSPGREDLG